MKNKRIKSMLEAMDEELPRALANEAKVEILLAEISHLQNRLWMSKRDARKERELMRKHLIKDCIRDCVTDAIRVTTDSDKLTAIVKLDFDK